MVDPGMRFRKLLDVLPERAACRMALRHSEHTEMDMTTALARIEDGDGMVETQQYNAGRLEAHRHFFVCEVLMSVRNAVPARA